MTHALYTLSLLAIQGSSPVQIRVDGDGYLRFAKGTQAVYATQAKLSVTKGLLCNADGYPLLPQIHVDPATDAVEIGLDGTITVSGNSVGKIVLVLFTDSTPTAAGDYWTASSKGSLGSPGEGVFGVIRIGSTTTASKVVAKPAATKVPDKKPLTSGKPSVVKTKSSKTSIQMAEHSEVEGSIITLGDVAKIVAPGELGVTLSNISLGGSPAPGSKKKLIEKEVVERLTKLGYEPQNYILDFPEIVEVTRKSHLVTPDEILTAARDAVKEQLGVEGEMRASSVIQEASICGSKVEVVGGTATRSGSGGNSFSIPVKIMVDGKPAGYRTVVLVPVEVSKVIKAFELVKIKITKGGATVEVDGKARTGGAVGSTVSVQTDAGAVLNGTVTAPGHVEVKL